MIRGQVIKSINDVMKQLTKKQLTKCEFPGRGRMKEQLLTEC